MGQKRRKHFVCFRSEPAVGSIAYGREVPEADVMRATRALVEGCLNLCGRDARMMVRNRLILLETAGHDQKG